MLARSLGRFLPTLCALPLVAAMCLDGAPVKADVRTSTQVRAYRVGGTTPASLVAYMKNRPFHGDRGAAVANIRPSYRLAIATTTVNGLCKATSVSLDMNFTITLPTAVSASAMDAGTRSAWNTFVSFARRHEETHRSIYVRCGNEFVAKAEQLTSRAGCGALQANIRSLLEAEKRACDARQVAFDRADYNRVFGLPLFTMSSYKSRKPIVSSAPGISRAIAAPAR